MPLLVDIQPCEQIKPIWFWTSAYCTDISLHVWKYPCALFSQPAAHRNVWMGLCLITFHHLTIETSSDSVLIKLRMWDIDLRKICEHLKADAELFTLWKLLLCQCGAETCHPRQDSGYFYTLLLTNESKLIVSNLSYKTKKNTTIFCVSM